MSLENKKFPLRKRAGFSKALRRFFGCVYKNVEGTEHKFISVSCQCQIEKDLEGISAVEENAILNETTEPPDDNEYSPLSEEFRSSLKKLDSLIITLNNIRDVYKSSNSMQCYNNQVEDVVFSGKENVNTKHEEDVLKFNINFDKNTFIECQTKKGKHSLKIIHNSGANISPLILHRCESEFFVKRKSYENIGTSASSEILLERSDQLQRSYHTLRGKFGGSIYSLSMFKNNILDHMRNIKSDVKTLRNILYYVECVTNREKYFLPLSFGDLRRWFLGCSNNMRYDDEKYIKPPECRYIEARIRAKNFCRFYILDKRNKEKRKRKIVNRSKY